MAQHDQVVDNGPGLAVRTDINAAIAALFSSNSGPTEPAVIVPGQLWFDTSLAGSAVLKVRDQTNSSWIALNSASSGDQTIGANFIINRPTLTPTYGFTGQKTGLTRWKIIPGDGAAESTGNAGSNFTVQRYSDAGAYIDTPFYIVRSNGGVVCAYTLNVGGAMAAASLNLGTALPVSEGGTGGTTQALAQSGLGLGTMATASAANYYTKTQIDALGLALSDGVSIGSYLLGTSFAGTALSPGSTIAGSQLRPDNAAGSLGATLATRSGTWRCLGGTLSGGGGGASTTLFQRIA